MIRAVLVCLVISGCASNGGSTGTDTSAVTCPPDSTLTYENFGKVLIEDQCLSCHTSKEKPALTTQAAIQTNASKILRVTVTSSQMPKGSSMLADERQLLGEWLACGAP